MSGAPVETDELASPVRQPRRLRLVGFVAGAGLLSAAVWAAARQGPDLEHVVSSLRDASAWLIAAALVLPLLDLLITSSVFWVLTKRFGRVGYGEMTALIGSAWLLNHLPLRPGLVGRVAYHKTVHGIRVRDAARVVAENLATNAVAMVIAMTGAMAMVWGWWAGALAAAMTVGVAAVMVISPGRGWRTAGPLGAAVLLRLCDMGVWTARYWVVFALAGQEITLPQATAVAVVAQWAMVVPLAGNGLGLREWAVALLASAMPAWMATEGAPSLAAGLSADLLNRMAEMVVAVPTGLVASALLVRRIRRTGRHGQPDNGGGG